MKIWLDAQLPPALAPWMKQVFQVDAVAVRDVGLRDALDPQIFQAARAAQAVLMTKDRDFVELVERHGPPPQVAWITCGNTTNSNLKQVLTSCFPQAMNLLEQGEPLVEISESKP